MSNGTISSKHEIAEYLDQALDADGGDEALEHLHRGLESIRDMQAHLQPTPAPPEVVRRTLRARLWLLMRWG